MRLEDIGFYTLSDERAAQATSQSDLHRCEMLVTKACNFKCPYCRGCGPTEELSLEAAKKVIDEWAKNGLRNVRFSGGEPTVWKPLIELVEYTKKTCHKIENIAISTNGSADLSYYQKLIDAGVSDFSVSLDACCASTGDIMSGVKGSWNRVIDAIRFLSERSYVTVGVVLTEENATELGNIIEFANGLGVSDIRIISAAQWNEAEPLVVEVSEEIRKKHPILSYRLNHLAECRNVRGIKETDTHSCPLVLDDMAVMDGKHYPCIIYMREGGEDIGEVGPQMREERKKWFEETDTACDPICKKNCLDVCIDYNNRWVDLNG